MALPITAALRANKLSDQVIRNTIAHVRAVLSGEGSGHDWQHVYRVYRHALRINRVEKADPFIVSLAALLHDIADHKFHGGDCEIGPRTAAAWLETQGVGKKQVEHVTRIIRDLSFKGAGTKSKMGTLEGKVVQDADRLDAIGAIGIARTFAYGGHKNRPLYDPEIRPQKHRTFEQYKNNASPTLNHFYEKLLLLKGLMNTKTAKKMAVERHAFMRLYLKTFRAELSG